jgi:Ca-activated chloride channel homolog
MKRLLLVLVIAGSCLQSSTSGRAAAPREPADRTLSPYFFVKSDDPAVDRLPLKSTAATVDIAGVIASVHLAQVYRNEGKRPLEAIYVFPGSTRAAVHGMKMTIGERVITATIAERQEARRQYETARQAGQTASLLEQQRPNVFQMNVANILPGDEIRVELTYTELLVPQDRFYEFVYPTVVGPRYSNTPADGGAGAERWVQNPYLRQGEAPTSTFTFRARIAAGMPLREVSSPSHEIQVSYLDQQRATIALPASERSGADRDVVLRYRLAEDRIETGVLLAEGGDERFFLCMVEPPRRFAPDAVPPRDYVFIMDVSGSMNGFPIETSKELLRNVLARLRPIDSFNVLFFSGGSYVLSPASVPATDANKQWAVKEIDNQQGGGGTELLPALRRAFSLPRSRQDISRIVVIATDGYVNVERESFTLIREHLGDANVFAFGIGSAVNRHLIEGMARIGEGEPFVVLNPGEARRAAARFLDYIESPLLSRIEIHTPGFGAYDVEPEKVPDLFAARPLVIVGKYHGEPAGEIVVTGYTGQGRFERHIAVSRGQANPANEGLKFLWARERVALLSDFSLLGGPNDNRREVLELGLKYNLLTEFTSFVAIDQHVRRQDGTLETVKQPLPLPQGVSDLAVGGGQGYAAAESVMVAPMVGGVRSARSNQPSQAAAPAPPTPRKDQAAPRTPAVQVELVETRLRSVSPIDATALRAAFRSALGAAGSCLASAVDPGARRVKISFDASGRVTRIELLEPARPGDPRDLVACIDAAVRRGITLPGVSGGYVVITIARVQ